MVEEFMVEEFMVEMSRVEKFLLLMGLRSSWLKNSRLISLGLKYPTTFIFSQY